MRITNELFSISGDFAADTVSTAVTLEHMAGFCTRADYTVAASTAQNFLADTQVSAANDTITLTGHGWQTARLVTLTSTGTLPGGLATSTNYYVIVVDANTVSLATSVANAQAGTAINITSNGTAAATHTATPTAFSGSMQLQGSVDKTNWDSVGTTPVTISATGSNFQNVADVFYPWLRVKFAVAAGQLDGVTVRLNAKGI